jgi:single-stranded DNA-binding protein
MTNLTIHGNLTKDVEIGTSENGTKYAHFTVASDRSRSKDSQTDFFRISAIGDWVEDLRDLAKGTFVKVSAYLKVGAEYNGHRQIEIVARQVERAATEGAA